jgi:hypothetical protein
VYGFDPTDWTAALRGSWPFPSILSKIFPMLSLVS